MNKMSETKSVEKQYLDDSNLNIRKALHNKYSTNKQGFGNWLFSQYEFKSGMKVLELGSGNGDMWFAHIDSLSNKIDLYLSDFSEGMVEKLRDHYSNFDVCISQIDIQSIPYEDNSFDLVIANMMLYHVPDLGKGLAEVERVLKPNGQLFAATFGEDGLSEYLNNLLYSLEIIEEGKLEYKFTLQKGKDILSEFFEDIQRLMYVDRLEVTDVKDILLYIKSMGSMSGIKESNDKKILSYLERQKDSNGVVIIPKEYGTFIAKKGEGDEEES